ncbi:hypothetical protein HN51_042724 [Arachis hypogaea]
MSLQSKHIIVDEDPIENETFVAETESVLIGASHSDDQRDVIVLDGIDSLILGRWTKKAKQPPINNHVFSGEIPDAAYMSMHAAMLDDCRELVKLSCSYFEDYFEVKTKIANERDALREKIRKRLATTAEGGGDDASIHDPPRAKHKGCGRHVVTTHERYRRVQRCRKCGKASRCFWIIAQHGRITRS